MVEEPRMMMAEHFFIIGAQRCGTTFLYRLLDEHPSIEMARPLKPEPKFLLDADLCAKGREYYEATYFEGRPGIAWRGEKSTTYIESPLVAERMAQLFPEARVVCLVRDPVARAVSNYLFSRNNGLESLGLWEAFEREEERRNDYDRDRVSTSPFAYLTRGRYIDYLEPYLERFPDSRIRVVVQEALVSSLETIRGLYEWFGVDTDFIPPTFGNVVNASRKSEEEKLTEAQVAVLRERFAEPNARLFERFGLDLGYWEGRSL
jgi:hypothetical protein